MQMLPKNVVRVAENEQFSFSCHKGIACFTHCCRHLELALTPYDVLRLKNALGIHSTDFLNRYVIMEHEEGTAYPHYYLTMVDDGKVSCVFVTQQGCSVYEDRPGACRAYPMGRASMRKKDGAAGQFFVLLKEEHCKGFDETDSQTPLQYSHEQGLERYNVINDALIAILQHDKLRQGMRLSTDQVDTFTLALYDLDRFRDQLFSGKIGAKPLSQEQKEELDDDEKLLLFAINWLNDELFSQP